VAFADGCVEPRNEIVPLTSLTVVLAAAAVFADAGASVAVGCAGVGALLQPARASAVTDMSDKTVLRMGKPHQRENKHETVQTPWRHDIYAGEVPSIAQKYRDGKVKPADGLPCASVRGSGPEIAAAAS
jgi:hypothetical protein